MSIHLDNKITIGKLELSEKSNFMKTNTKITLETQILKRENSDRSALIGNLSKIKFRNY